MASPNFQNRTLFHSDNLPILQGMNSETVDLIATDPPFNKGKDFHATPDSLAAGAKFTDRWSWERDVHEVWTDAIQDDYPAVWSVIQFARRSYGDDMGAFLCFMGVRLMEMHRILKPTGSIYLHCDPTASHYLKAMLDAIFGRNQFRNEIVWGYNKWTNNMGGFQRNHDIILFYTKERKGATFNRQFGEPTKRMREIRRLGYNGGSNNKGIKILRVYDREKAKAQIESGKYAPENIYYIDEPLTGNPITSHWTDIGVLNGRASERTGFRTQKPLALYERIIAASSNPGDMVLDPFAGCATTPIAAERLGRQWVGIDLWDGAYEIVRRRMEDNRQLASEGNREVVGDLNPQIIYATAPPERTDDGDAAAPALRLRPKRPVFAWQKLSRRQMSGILGEAQASPNDPNLIVCAGCGRMMEMAFMELDHIQPKSDRGSNDIGNRILLCGPCNRVKGAEKTLRGLINDNRKSGWTTDSVIAESARLRAERMAERVELEWDSNEIQTLAEKHK